MGYEQIAECLEQLAARCVLSAGESQALEDAICIVRSRPFMRTTGEVQNIVAAVRAGLEVQIDYYDPEPDDQTAYDCCCYPTY